jgi:hypothetical protein
MAHATPYHAIIAKDTPPKPVCLPKTCQFALHPVRPTTTHKLACSPVFCTVTLRAFCHAHRLVGRLTSSPYRFPLFPSVNRANFHVSVKKRSNLACRHASEASQEAHQSWFRCRSTRLQADFLGPCSFSSQVKASEWTLNWVQETRHHVLGRTGDLHMGLMRPCMMVSLQEMAPWRWHMCMCLRQLLVFAVMCVCTLQQNQPTVAARQLGRDTQETACS